MYPLLSIQKLDRWKMEKYNEIELLNKRVDVLEQKILRLSRLFIQMSEELALEKDTGTAVKNAPISKENLENRIYNTESINDKNENMAGLKKKAFVSVSSVEDDKSPHDKGEALQTDIYQGFVEKYISESGEFALNLDVARNISKELNRYKEWEQVPENTKNALYLSQAYEIINYWADPQRIKDETLYLVAPADPDREYSQTDFIRMALPNFFELEGPINTSGGVLQLIRPAIFTKNNTGDYVLKDKGKIIITEY